MGPDGQLYRGKVRARQNRDDVDDVQVSHDASRLLDRMRIEPHLQAGAVALEFVENPLARCADAPGWIVSKGVRVSSPE